MDSSDDDGDAAAAKEEEENDAAAVAADLTTTTIYASQYIRGIIATHLVKMGFLICYELMIMNYYELRRRTCTHRTPRKVCTPNKNIGRLKKLSYCFEQKVALSAHEVTVMLL